ncbi:MAG: hypothetical protein IJ890_06170 [Clostridia bacterium]|nr:hypothetical protein [Clostridia bacterium]
MPIEYVIAVLIIAGIAFAAGILVSNYVLNKWQNKEESYMTKEEYDRLRKK